jgi:hypothetical protein
MEVNGWSSPQMLRRYGASARSARGRRTYDRIMAAQPDHRQRSQGPGNPAERAHPQPTAAQSGSAPTAACVWRPFRRSVAPLPTDSTPNQDPGPHSANVLTHMPRRVSRQA